MTNELAQDWLEAWPVRARERARDVVSRARAVLALIAKRQEAVNVVHVSPDDTASVLPITDLVSDRPKKSLAYSTVILPCSAGGLADGLPEGRSDGLVTDVSDEPGERERWRLEQTEPGVWKAIALSGEHGATDIAAEDLRAAMKALEAHTGLRRVFDTLAPETDLRETDEPSSVLMWLSRARVLPPDDRDWSAQGVARLGLAEHLSAVGRAADGLGRAVDLPGEVREALRQAGELHDLGKNRSWWQAAIGHFDGAPLAKSGHSRFDQRVNGGYRHEFGSLMEAEALNLPEGTRDLILHLVGSHHGWGRPGFPVRAYDRARSQQTNAAVALEAARRFERLQRDYGWWSLAYLEALLKTADVLGSRPDATPCSE